MQRKSKKRLLIGLGLIVVLAAAAIGTATTQSVNKQIKAANEPDLILYNGKITTLDSKNTVVKAIAIRDGVVIASDDQSGRIKALAGDDTQVVNLNGRRVLPGLIDGHLHGMREGYHCWTQVVRLDLVTNRSVALAKYAAKAAELDDGLWIWTTAGGWNVNQLDVPVIFTFAELNAAAPANPLWITGSGFAGPRVNQAALDALGLVPGSPGVVLDANGVPTGQLTGDASTASNEAILAQLNARTIDDEALCLADFVREANSRGLTSWKDAGGNDAPWGTGGAINEGLHVEEPTMALYRAGGLNARIAYNAMSAYEGFPRVVSDTQNSVGFQGDDMFKYLGPGEDTMATMPNYIDYTEYSAGRRLSVETHVGGPIDAILDGFEAGNAIHSVGELKWRIAHPGNGDPTDDQLARAEALGTGWALTISGVRNGATGPRFRTTMENSAHMCLSTDAMNVAPWAPFQNLWYVTTGETLLPGVSGVPADQQLTRMEALLQATVECAWFLDLDGKLGTLEPGMLADMIVLSDDYFTVPGNAIKDIHSLLTVVDGEIVYGEGPYAGLD